MITEHIHLEPEPWPRRLWRDSPERFWLLVMMALGLGLRLVLLGSYAYGPAELAHFFPQPGAAIDSPLLTWLLRAWGAAGLDENEWLMRLPSCLASVALIPLAYALAQRLSGKMTGLLAAGLTATLPYLTMHGQDIAPDALGACGVLLALWAGLQAQATRRLEWWMLFAAACGMAMAGDPRVAPALAALSMGLLVATRSRAEAFGWGAANLLVLAFTFPLARFVPLRHLLGTAGVESMSEPAPPLWVALRHAVLGEARLPGLEDPIAIAVLGLGVLGVILALRASWRRAAPFAAMWVAVPVASWGMSLASEGTLPIHWTSWVALLALALAHTLKALPTRGLQAGALACLMALGGASHVGSVWNGSWRDCPESLSPRDVRARSVRQLGLAIAPRDTVLTPAGDPWGANHRVIQYYRHAAWPGEALTEPLHVRGSVAAEAAGEKESPSSAVARACLESESSLMDLFVDSETLDSAWLLSSDRESAERWGISTWLAAHAFEIDRRRDTGFVARHYVAAVDGWTRHSGRDQDDGLGTELTYTARGGAHLYRLVRADNGAPEPSLRVSFVERDAPLPAAVRIENYTREVVRAEVRLARSAAILEASATIVVSGNDAWRLDWDRSAEPALYPWREPMLTARVSPEQPLGEVQGAVELDAGDYFVFLRRFPASGEGAPGPAEAVVTTREQTILRSTPGTENAPAAWAWVPGGRFQLPLYDGRAWFQVAAHLPEGAALAELRWSHLAIVPAKGSLNAYELGERAFQDTTIELAGGEAKELSCSPEAEDMRVDVWVRELTGAGCSYRVFRERTDKRQALDRARESGPIEGPPASAAP